MPVEQLSMTNIDDIRKTVLKSIKPSYIPILEENQESFSEPTRSINSCTLRQRNVFLKK
jgi:hypothetical protein